MNFVYKPVYISDWVNREIKHRRRTDYDTAEFQTLLNEFKSLIYYYADKKYGEFKEWFEKVNPKKFKVFPFLMEHISPKNRWKLVQDKLLQRSKKDPRLFDYALEACYIDHRFEGNWKIVRESYIENKAAVTQGWSSKKKIFWDDFVKVENRQQHFILGEMKKSLNFNDLIDFLMLKESHSFYNSVLLELFSNGTQEFYKDQQEKFIELMNQSDNVKQQILAGGFIRSNSVFKLQKISQVIYKNLGTYVRQPMKWSDVGEKEKIAFHGWVMSKELKNFFGNLNQNHERFKYWEKFSTKLEKVVVLSQDKTMLMYFYDVVIIEVLGVGAVYVYDKDFFNQKFGQRIAMHENDTQSNRYSYSRHVVRRSLLMEKEWVVTGGWLTHNQGWQANFDRFLSRRLGWEVNENEIIRKQKIFDNQ
ncbi:hypothetical protein HU147_10125 [Planomicrobium chinense]|uniref:hypothetical protein n=1 Tax=Planococcus chinensis TaxID=272917 RepID=UPI001CC552B0|nr:hypothetical protein [Planococcus chinensis]MBZ5201572.1 hypothetical protein [Planococcus chinensis]